MERSRIEVIRLTPDATNGHGHSEEVHGEGFKRRWPPLIKMNEAVKAIAEKRLGWEF